MVNYIEMLTEEFINQIKQNELPLVFLLGAGCSRSSGIPCAKELAEKWAKKIENNPSLRRSVDTALLNPGMYAENYFQLFLEAHPGSGRKNEIMSFTKMGYPGPGYVSLARLLDDSPHKLPCNMVISTNFDNLLEHAFYLFTNTTPVLIPDKSLFKYIDDFIESSVYIVKIHGDRCYNPLNEQDHVDNIDDSDMNCIEKGIKTNSVLVVIGYSGRDKGIASLIARLVNSGKIGTIYWAGALPHENAFSELPTGVKNQVQIFNVHDKNGEYVDFDSMMLLLESKVGLKHLLSTKMDEHMYKHYDFIMQEMGLYGDNGSQNIILEEASFEDYFYYFVAAAKQLRASSALSSSGINAAKDILEKGMQLYRRNPNYIVFMGAFYKNICGDNKKAIDLFKTAKRYAPNHAGACAELANALKEEVIQSFPSLTHVKKTQKAKKAIDAIIDEFDMAEKRDPRNLNNLLNYAGFLLAAKGSSENEALKKIKKCQNHIHSDMHQLEFAFYVFAHQLQDIGWLSAINDLLKLLGNARSPKFDLSWNVERARLEKHPQVSLVRDIAVIINNGVGNISRVRRELELIKSAT